MEAFRLNSRVIEDEKEYLIQTVNDANQGVIKTSLFADGEFLDAEILPHSERMSEDQVLNMVKTAHGEKKSELEYLLKSFREVIQNGTPEMMYQLGSALYYRRMYPEAARLFRSASKIKGDFHEAWFYLSQTELALKNAEEAIQAGSRAVELRPNFADYRNNLGEAYLASKLCRDAVREFNEAIKSNVYYADAYFNLGVTYVLNAINKEDYEMADDYAVRTRDLLNKASLIYPFYKTSDFNAALTALANDDPASAHSMLTRVREDIKEKHRLEKASYIHRFLMSTDWINKENIDDRISILEREIDKNPGYVDLYYDMAVCQLHRAKFGWEEAIDSFMQALNINPELKKAQRALDLARDQFLKIADSIVDITSRKS